MIKSKSRVQYYFLLMIIKYLIKYLMPSWLNNIWAFSRYLNVFMLFWSNLFLDISPHWSWGECWKGRGWILFISWIHGFIFRHLTRKSAIYKCLPHRLFSNLANQTENLSKLSTYWNKITYSRLWALIS